MIMNHALRLLFAIRFLLLAFCLGLPAGSAAAQEVTAEQALRSALAAVQQDKPHEALKAAHQAMLLLTQKDRLHIRTAALVQADPGGFGIFQEKAAPSYRPGEDIHVYIEPGAFKYARSGDYYEYGFSVDFRLVKTDGNVLGGQDKFGTFPFRSFRPNTEIFLDLTLSLTGVPEGDYVIKVIVHDLVSEETAEADFPFAIAVN